MFCANKCHWFSAAELATYVLTGGHCLVSHCDVPVFTSRLHFMCQECKRYFNNEDLLDTQAQESGRYEAVESLSVRMAQPAVSQQHEASAEMTDKGSEQAPTALHVFRATTSLIDDWLHRGDALADCDLYLYSICFERVQIGFTNPKDVAYVVFPFDPCYALADG